MARVKFRDRLLVWLLKGLIVFFRALPLQVSARIGRGMGLLAYLADRRHRLVAITNLTAVFGDTKPARDIRALARENFRRIGENYVSGVCTAGMSNEKVAGLVELAGFEKLSNSFEAGRNLIIAMGHFGNFEVMPQFRFKLPGYQFATSYRALSPKPLDDLYQSFREKSGCIFIERRRAQFEVGKLLRGGRILFGMLSDQHGGPRGVRGLFLGAECSTSAAPFVYTLRHDGALHPAFCFRTKIGRWRIEVCDEIPVRTEDGSSRPVEEVIGEMNAAFERAVLRDPANWFWVHNRWQLVARTR